MLRVKLAEPAKSWEPGKLADADQAELGAAAVVPREPVKLTDQDQLVVEAGIEPEHSLGVLAATFEPRVLTREPAKAGIGPQSAASGRGQKLGAEPAPGVTDTIGRRRAFVQQVTPDADLARHAALPQLCGRRIATVNVKHACIFLDS